MVMRRRLTREKLLASFANLGCCMKGMEACASARYWGRELRKLRHEVRLINPKFANTYVKSSQSDPNDTETLCEAVRWPSMRFVSAQGGAKLRFFAPLGSGHLPPDFPVTTLVPVNAGHTRTPSVTGDLPEIAKNLRLHADSEKKDGN
jgi:hypothetical protein